MREDEIAAVLTWANQNDPKRIEIDNHDVMFTRWVSGLSHVNATAEQAKVIITDYYANAHPADNGYLPPISPQVIRKRLTDAREHAQARRSALEAPQRQAIEAGAKRERVRRWASPEFQAAMVDGAIDHLEDLERRNIIKPDQQKRLNDYRDTGVYKRPGDGRGI